MPEDRPNPKWRPLKGADTRHVHIVHSIRSKCLFSACYNNKKALWEVSLSQERKSWVEIESQHIDLFFFLDVDPEVMNSER